MLRYTLQLIDRLRRRGPWLAMGLVIALTAPLNAFGQTMGDVPVGGPTNYSPDLIDLAESPEEVYPAGYEYCPPEIVDGSPSDAPWMVAPPGQQPYVDADVYFDQNAYPGPGFIQPPSQYWQWQVLPAGVMYRSYMAGVRESRIALHTINLDSSLYWDATLGGRAAILRYGTNDPFHPQGWEIGVEGAGIVRLNWDEERDLDSSDFRFGVPLSYATGNWQFKFGYYHLSSHLGDEFIARNPGADRDNYVRDALVLGASYYVVPALRLYGETSWAFYTGGRAEPWEFQFGAEYAQPGPTGSYGTPFLAVNAHLHEETNYSGNFTAQTGWLWRGETGSTMRIGVHYLNGASSQYQFVNNSEQQIGLGLWYDF